MIKKIASIKLLLCLTFFCKAQTPTIIPSQTTEICPNQEITFQITLPGLCSNIFVFGTAVSVAPTVTQTPFNISANSNTTGFNFKGKFLDNNSNQTFTVQYNDAGGVTRTFPFTFTRVKSLLFASNANQIFPTNSTIVSPRCQITTHNISFQNCKYGTSADLAVSFGTVADFEYLLPVGWSLNGGPASNGSTWIAGSNNVTLTTDLSNGDGGFVKIRASNIACGAGLQTSAILAQIPITRANPTNLNITGDDLVCSTSNNYVINNAPPGSSYSWSATPTGIVSINSPNSVSTTISKIADGLITLNAVVSNTCFGSPINISKANIAVGNPTAITNISTTYSIIHCTVNGYKNEIVGAENATNFKWSYRNITQGTGFTLYRSSSIRTQRSPSDGSCDQIEILVEATNGCTATPQTYTFPSDMCPPYTDGSCSSGRSIAVYPNPGVSNVQVTLVDAVNVIPVNTQPKKIKQLRIVDKMGQIKKTITGNDLDKITISVSDLPIDIYTILVYDGKEWMSKQISKN